MANPSIGGISFIALTGAPLTPLATVLEEHKRPGVNGRDYDKNGQISDTVTLESIKDYESVALAEAGIAAYKALQGTLATVIDDKQTTHTNVMIKHVSVSREKAIGLIVGAIETAPTHILRASWTLEKTT